MSQGQMDPTTTFLQDTELLYLRFPWGLRKEDILWLLGVYFEYAEDRVILRGGKASVEDFVGHVNYMWGMATYEAIPTIGVIPARITWT